MTSTFSMKPPAATFVRVGTVTACVTLTGRVTIYDGARFVALGRWSDALRGFERVTQIAPVAAEVRDELERGIAWRRKQDAA